MAYPFLRGMTFKEFRKRLESEHGCEFKQGSELENQERDTFRISYVTREVDGKEIHRAMEFGNDDEFVNPSVVRSTCARLKIDVAEFGYHLG